MPIVTVPDQPGVVVVSGGTYGIGRAITVTLARRGFRVVAFALDARQIGSAAENGRAGTLSELRAAGCSADVLECDVSVESDVKRVIAFALERYGRVDGLINNAALHPRGNALTTALDVWEKVLAVNLTGAFICAKTVLPHMISAGGGSIVNIGSGSGWGRANLLAYCASKGGLYALTMALAYDHMIDRVSVNMVIPGGTMTGATAPGYSLPGFEEVARRTVTGEPTQPADIANAVAFLLSPEARQITGSVIDVGCFSHQGGPARAQA